MSTNSKMLLVSLFAVLSVSTSAQGNLELWIGGVIAGRVDGQTGEYLGDLFYPPADAEGFTIGPDGNIYAAGYPDCIKRYDGQTRELMDVFVAEGSGGLDYPMSPVFGPDGNLYVASESSSDVMRYNGQTGEFMDVFASEGLSHPNALRFGPDGNLYVTSPANDSILRYDGTTGDLIDVFASGGVLDDPVDLLFHDDGLIYVSDWENGTVVRFDATTGESLGAFVAAHSGGLSRPFGLAFGPDDNLYVADNAGEQDIMRYDGETGEFIDVFCAPLAGIQIEHATFIAFVPEPGGLGLVVVGTLCLMRRRQRE